VTDKDKDNGGK